MALQTATPVAPSTNTNSDSNALATATSSANSTDTTAAPTNPNDLGKNSIPFSFLVAFLALFVAFMGIGLFARRFVYFIRLRLGLAVPEPSGRERRGGKRVKKERPVIWDVCIHPAQDDCSTGITEDVNDKWRDIRPLACYYLRDQTDGQPQNTYDTHTDTPSRTSHYTHPTLLPHAFVGTGRMSIAPVPPPRSFFRPPDTSLPSTPTPTPTTTRTTSNTYDSPTRTRITSPHPLQDIMLNIHEFLHPHPHPHTHTQQHHHNTKQKTRANGEDLHTKDQEGRHAESVRIATLIAMPSEDRRWRNKLKAGHDRTSVGSSTTSTSMDGEDVGGIEQYGGGGLSIGVADVLLDWRGVDTWEEDVEEDEKT